MANEFTAEQASGAAPPHVAPGSEGVPVWVVVATALSSTVFTLGVLTATTTGALELSYTAQEVVLYAALATVGRLVAVVVQAAVVGGAAGPAGRWRAARRGLLVATFLGQVPLAARDVLLGVLALTGVLELSRVVMLAMSPLDPFSLLAVWVFHRRARAVGLERRTHVQVVVAFAAYLYLLRLALFALGVVPGA